jgi:urease accessory protein
MPVGLFRSIPVVERIAREDQLPPDATAFERDVITLGWEDRLKTRARRTADSGFEFATALPRGTVLRAGDAFVMHDVSRVVTVRERAEPVFVIRPSTPIEWGLWAYQIGNSHQPLMVTDAALVCPDLPGMEQVLQYHAIPFTRDVRVFTPASQGPAHHGGA